MSDCGRSRLASSGASRCMEPAGSSVYTSHFSSYIPNDGGGIEYRTDATHHGGNLFCDVSGRGRCRATTAEREGHPRLGGGPCSTSTTSTARGAASPTTGLEHTMRPTTPRSASRCLALDELLELPRCCKVNIPDTFTDFSNIELSDLARLPLLVEPRRTDGLARPMR
eukprot:1098008-Pyramimonas_sp.AAC.1